MSGISGSGYYNLRQCKTCAWWEPFNGVCFNGNSEHRADFTCRDDSCLSWSMHRHRPGCGGMLEAREYNGRIEHYCYGCLYTVLIDGKPIPETRDFLTKEVKT